METAEAGSDFVELPGLPVKDRWGSWDPTIILPKRRVALPVERWFQRASWGAAPIFLIAMIALLPLIYFDISTFRAEGWCSGKNGHHYGSGCYFSIGFEVCMAAFALLGVLYFWRKKAYLELAAPIRGPHLIIKRDTFWHAHLSEPINFSDMTSVRRGEGFLIIACNRPLKGLERVVSGVCIWSNPSTEFGFATEVFSDAPRAAGDELEWVDTFLTLAAQHDVEIRKA